MWLLWVSHAPNGSRQARVNEVRSSVRLGVQSRSALVPDATALRVSVPVGGVVGVVGVGVVVGVVGVGVVGAVGVSSSMLAAIRVTSATGS